MAEGLKISNSSANTQISGTGDDDTLSNVGYYVTILAGEGNDSIYNYGSKVKIFAGDGNDNIDSGNYGRINGDVTIYGGNGDDIIYSYDAKAYCDGEEGNDFIRHVNPSLHAQSSATLKGGTGNDTIDIHITDSDYIILYDSGDGNDSFTRFSSDDTIKIGYGVLNSATVVDNDVLLTIGNGTISLVSAKDKNIAVEDPAGTHKFTNSYTGPTASLNKTAFKNGVDYYMDNIQNAVGNIANRQLETESLLAQFKNSVTPKNFPSEVYEKIAEELANVAVQEIDNFALITKWQGGELVQQINNLISKWTSTINTSVKVNGTTYSITIPFSGMVNHATVTNESTAEDYSVDWSSDQAKNAANKYIAKLTQLESELCTKVIVSCATDTIFLFLGFLGDGKVDTFFKAFVKDVKTFKTIPEITLEEFTAEFKSYVSQILGYDENTITNFAKKYIALSDYATALKNDNDVTASSASYRNFINAYNDLASMLGISSISYDVINSVIDDPNTWGSRFTTEETPTINI